MPKIKNWSRCGYGPSGFGIAWCHDNEELNLSVDIEWIHRGFWAVTVYDGKENRVIANPPDEASARYYAVKWMREHPDGVD
jgi:hypothetical protein